MAIWASLASKDFSGDDAATIFRMTFYRKAYFRLLRGKDQSSGLSKSVNSDFRVFSLRFEVGNMSLGKTTRCSVGVALGSLYLLEVPASTSARILIRLHLTKTHHKMAPLLPDERKIV